MNKGSGGNGTDLRAVVVESAQGKTHLKIFLNYFTINM